jgi:hypothetical protein
MIISVFITNVDIRDFNKILSIIITDELIEFITNVVSLMQNYN